MWAEFPNYTNTRIYLQNKKNHVCNAAIHHKPKQFHACNSTLRLLSLCLFVFHRFCCIFGLFLWLHIFFESLWDNSQHLFVGRAFVFWHLRKPACMCVQLWKIYLYVCVCVHLRQKAIVCICDTRKCQYTCSTRPFRQRIAAFTVTHTANSSILLVLSHSWRLRLTSHLLCVLLTCLCHHLNRNYFCSIKFWSIATWRLQFTLSTSITAALNLATKILLRVLLTPTLQTSFCVSYWLLTRRH